MQGLQRKACRFPVDKVISDMKRSNTGLHQRDGAGPAMEPSALWDLWCFLCERLPEYSIEILGAYQSGVEEEVAVLISLDE